MKKLILLILLLPALCWADGKVLQWPMSGGGATDWTADESAVAYYRFESGAQTTDSVGTNTLSCVTSGECPSENTTSFVEGSASTTVTPVGVDKSYYIAQTSMSSDFIGYGSTSSEVTVGGWVRVATLASADYLFALDTGEYGDGRDKAFSLRESDSSGTLSIILNGNFTAHSATGDIVASEWYFFAAVFSATEGEVMLYLRSDDGSSLYEYNTTATLETSLDQLPASGVFVVGGEKYTAITNAPYADLDALAVFGRAFTKNELDGVFSNGWDGAGW